MKKLLAVIKRLSCRHPQWRFWRIKPYESLNGRERWEYVHECDDCCKRFSKVFKSCPIGQDLNSSK